LFLERHFDESIRLSHNRLTEYRDLPTGNGPVSAGQVAIEWASMLIKGGNTPMLLSGWTPVTTIPISANATTEYRTGWVSGMFRTRISQTVTGGTVTVVAVRPEEEKGWNRRQS
jgi:hypothetical protein